MAMSYLWIFIGGGLGSIARFGLSGILARHIGETFPWGTMLVNITGSFVIGFVDVFSGPEGRWFISASARLFLTAGICGGYTTFSSFSLQTLTLIRENEPGKAGMNVVLSVVSCLVAVWLGQLLAARFNSLDAG